MKVHASAVNDYDRSMVRGKPVLYRLLFGLFKPKHPTPGMELSGTIEKVDEGANSFKVGDEVFGDISGFGFGAMAEFIAIHENALVRKPSHLSRTEAASLPHASLLAWQSIQPHLNNLKGGQILINGGGGGVGTFGVQILKQYGSDATGVDTGPKLQMMSSLGFDEVIDYKQIDFTKNGIQYNLILDCKTNRSPFSYLASLKPKGIYITVGGSLSKILSLVLLKGLIQLFTGKSLSILALKPNQGIEGVLQMHQNGHLKCIIDGPYPLKQYPEKLQYFGEGKHSGKVIIQVTKT